MCKISVRISIKVEVCVVINGRMGRGGQPQLQIENNKSYAP
jgi:hypothetical protein